MTMLSRYRFIITAVFLFFSTASSATNIKPAVEWNYFHKDFSIGPDDMVTEDFTADGRILTKEAVQSLGQQSFSYKPALGSAQLISAETIKKDGVSIPVGKDSVHYQKGQTFNIGFSDTESMVLQFPSLDVGDRIVYHVRQTYKPDVPGVINIEAWFSPEVIFDDVKVTLSAPRDMSLYSEPIQGTLREYDDHDRHIWTWTDRIDAKSMDPSENGSMPAVLYRPGIHFSSLKDYDELGKRAAPLYTSREDITPAIQKLADDLTRGKDSQLDQIKAIYQWVNSNIRYVGTWLGDGNWTPHAAEEVLDNRYGDCKDHVVIFASLLAAKGISSVPTLLGANEYYWLPKVPDIALFNHVITYVPSENLYLDTTSELTPFGLLPIADIDAPVVQLRNSQAADEIKSPSLEENSLSYDTEISVHPDGSADERLKITGYGSRGVEIRQRYRYVVDGNNPQFLKNLLASYNFEGDGHIDSESAADGGNFALSITLSVKNFLDTQRAGAQRLSPLTADVFSLWDIAKVGTQTPEEHRHRYGCPGIQILENYTLKFPPGFQEIIPPGTQAEHGRFSYRSHYSLSDHTVTASRVYQSAGTQGLCDPTDFPDQKSVSAAVANDIRKQILFRTDRNQDFQD